MDKASEELDRLRRENDQLWAHVAYLEALLDEARQMLGAPPRDHAASRPRRMSA
jgi:hypothetical protein